jgi:HAD superfamily hydrolase (TIGR01490 family)
MSVPKKQKFAVFDVDGTFFRSGLYRELVQEFIKRNEFGIDELKNIKDLEWQWRKNRSDATFNQLDIAMLGMFEAKLPDVSLDAYDEVVHAVIENHMDNVFSYTYNLAKQLKTEGYKLIAISGSQAELVERFMTNYGFDICIGLVHERSEGAFTGQSRRVYDKKHTLLQEIVEKEQLTYKESIGVGDSAGDIKMMSLVDRAIAFNPDSRLMQHAHQSNWEIIVERKGCIYNIPHDAIVTITDQTYA